MFKENPYISCYFQKKIVKDTRKEINGLDYLLKKITLCE